MQSQNNLMEFPLEVRLKYQQDANNELMKKIRQFEKLNDGIMDENKRLKEENEKLRITYQTHIGDATLRDDAILIRQLEEENKKLKEEKKLGLEVCNKLNNKIKKLNNKIKKLNKKITPPLTERILPNGTIFIS